MIICENRVMLVLLDTTAIMNDPHCNGAAWRVLAHAAPAWHVRVLIPEVVIIEAAGGHRRRIDEARAALDGWGRKHAGPLGLSHVQQEAAEMLGKSADGYRSTLNETLATLDVETVPPPDTEHAVLVERAASRRKPCNSNGDGYRDTLNWLTLLSLASRHPNEEIIWVSNNSRDFGVDDSDALHPTLIEELQEAGADQRVSWVRTLPDLILKLAASNNIDDATDVETIQSRLKSYTLNEFISNETLSSSVGLQLDSRQCALPIVATAANILAVGEISEPTFTVRGSIGETGSVVEFSVQAETSIQLRYPIGTLDDSVLTPTPIDGSESVGQIIKRLIYTGLLTLDKYDRPTGGELTRVFATDDDPGFLQWAATDLVSSSRDVRAAVASYLSSVTLPAIPPDHFKNLFPKLPPETYVNVNLLPKLPPDYFKYLIPTLPPDYLKNLVPRLPPDYLKNLVSTLPPDYFKTLFPKLPESYLASQFRAYGAAKPRSKEDLDEPDNEPQDDPGEGPSDET